MTLRERVEAGGYGPPGGGPPGYGGPPPGYGGPPGFGAPPPPPAGGGFGPPGQPPYGGGYGPPPPQFGPPGFGPGGFGPPPVAGGQTETLAIISLVLGLLCLPGGCCCSIFVAPFAIGGGVTGFLALNKITASGGMLGGKPLAIAGIVCSALAMVLGIVRIAMGAGMMLFEYLK